jgi:hypothetical protein
MLPRKANLYVLMLVALITACTKENTSPVSSSSSVETNAVQQLLIHPTIFGLCEDDTSYNDIKTDMGEAGVNIIRQSIYLSERTSSRTIDKYLSDGYNVQIDISWFDSTNGYRGFPTDTNAVKLQADAFFKNYSDRKAHIPFVTVENEWDYQVQHGSNLQDYLKELSIITAIGHKYGFKIGDGGITSGALQRWTYSQLTGTAQEQWKKNYYVGLNNDYDALLNIVNTYIATAKKINFDYSNVHWYNSIRCCGGYTTASQAFLKACNKKIQVCNEFGIRTSSLTLFTQTVTEITNNARLAIAYSGSNVKGKAITLTDAMLHVLK